MQCWLLSSLPSFAKPFKPAFMTIDPIALSQKLLRCKSITPIEAGALTVLQQALAPLGFALHRISFGEGEARVENLFAVRAPEVASAEAQHICFAGHVDVVPTGDVNRWSVDPFAADVNEDGVIIARGAVDMKPAIAAWVAAIGQFLADNPNTPHTLSLLITCDEEGDAQHGTKPMIGWLQQQNMVPDGCVVGEPTNPTMLGEMIKIGRRGSVTFHLQVNGTQGHVAYPDQADNPLTPMAHITHELAAYQFDEGTDHFQPSNLELTSVDVDNKADNVIPASVTATFNVRFNDLHRAQDIIDVAEGICARHSKDYVLTPRISGEAFLTQPGNLSSAMAQAVEHITGRTPQLSTTGGTSDARFIKDICPVVECGLINKTAHKIDEQVRTEDITNLTAIYHAFLTAL